ncbi:hypothetical protein [Pleurocapsa sp. FMAR1]|nr:hypothetical protein [Pleurocapsa sp. FMAR1]
MERRSLLKWLEGFTARILLTSKTNAQQNSDRPRKLLSLRIDGGKLGYK